MNRGITGSIDHQTTTFGESTTKTRAPSARRPALDGIRAFAIMAVFASHALPFGGSGWMGVEVFFALSGYLITDLLIQEHHLTGGVALGRFYMRRMLRLYPALVILLILGVFFYPVLGDGGTLAGYVFTAVAAGFYIQDFVWGFSGAHGGFGHTWSLAVEEQFYLLWPLALILILRARQSIVRISLVVAVASLVLTAIFASHSSNPPGSYFLPWTQGAVLLSGCALAAAHVRLTPRTAHRLALLGPVGLLLLMAAASQFDRQHYLEPLLAGAAIFSTALIAGVEADPRFWVARVLAWRPIEYLGRISYGFYLYYLVVTELLSHVQVNWPARAALEFIAILACAMVSYRFVETPFLRRKARYSTVARADYPERGGVAAG